MNTLEQKIAQLELDPRHDLLQLHESGGLLTGLAEARFSGLVADLADDLGLSPAVRYAVPQPVVAARRTALLAAPQAAAAQLNETLLGDRLERLSELDGWCLVRTMSDDYLGWVPAGSLISSSYSPTHTVIALRAHAFTGPRVQSARLLELAWGETLRVIEDGHGSFSLVRLPDGRDAFVATEALAEGAPAPVADFAAAARSLLGAPYVWGGNTAWGLDCSGLAQLVHAMAGNQLPRDADEQFQAGEAIDLSEARPGDAVCFRGHIGIITGPELMVHSTATGMRVREEPVFVRDNLRESYLGTVRFG